MRIAIAACLGLHGVAAEHEVARQRSLEMSWDHELQPDTKIKTYVSPVKRVTNLLKKMKAELDAEADKEAEMYEKMVCWCETNEKEKKKAVSDADAKDNELSAEIETRAARFGVLSASIEDTKKQIKINMDTLNKATSIREEEAAVFRGEEKDLVQAITNLRNAIQVLSKHQKTQALLQMDGSVVAGMRVLLRDVALKYEELVAGRAEKALSLLSLRSVSVTRRLAESDTHGVNAALLSALDIKSGVVSESLPLKFAEQLIANAAQTSRHDSRASKFLQVDEHQPLYESRSSARSAGIYGIMTQMLDEFEAELSESQKDELKAHADYKALAAAKSAEIDAGKKKLDEMQGEDSANQKALSDAKEDLTNTRDQRSDDVKFLQDLQTTCNDLDTKREKRVATRDAERKTVAEAIVILTGDDNREHLAKTVTLLQTREQASATRAMRASAVAVLRRAASNPGFEADDLLAAWHGRSTPTLGAAAGPRAQLSTLAMAVQIDSFTKVKEMMDKMLAALKKEQQDEVEFKAYCEKELNENEKTTYDKNELRKDLETKIDQLETLIKRLQGDIEEAKSQIANAEVEIKKASQTREGENSEFQTIVADQRATQSILKKALQKLKDFYQKGMGNKVALAQRDAYEPPVSPLKFNSYKTNEGASPVIGLIEQILEDSKAVETEATDAETSAQAAYERFVKDSNALIKNLQAAITSKTKAIAAANGDMAQASADHENTVGELESLVAYEADLHGQCDFTRKNFDIRQKARLEEMEAIQAAKAILSGTK